MDNETKKTLRLARIGVYLTAALLAVVCVALLVAVPRVTRALDHMEATMGRIDALSESAGSALETAAKALESANSAAERANALVADNADNVTEAMEKLNSIDFETLNKAIDDLASVVEPLARVSNFFNR